MSDLAHIRDVAGVWTLIRRYALENGHAKGRVVDAAGRIICAPPVAGFAKGDDKVVPVETATDDQSSTALTQTAVVTTVEAARVLDTTVTTDVAVTAQMVKDEAYRRIVAICPEWKQRNLTAQATILAEKGRTNWTAGELAAWNAGEAVWAQIKALRDASDLIEAMDPIPADYATNDTHWQ